MMPVEGPRCNCGEELVCAPTSTGVMECLCPVCDRPKMADKGQELMEIMEEYTFEGYVTCRSCGLLLDDNNCPDCGWVNPICEVI